MLFTYLTIIEAHEDHRKGWGRLRNGRVGGTNGFDFPFLIYGEVGGQERRGLLPATKLHQYPGKGMLS